MSSDSPSESIEFLMFSMSLFFNRIVRIEMTMKSVTKMSKSIKITCLNNNITKEYEIGKSLKEIADDLNVKRNNFV